MPTLLSKARSWLSFRDAIAKNYLVTHRTEGQVNGFFFSISRTDSVELRSEITNYFVEDNTAIADHIAIHPARISLTGYVGEKTFNSIPAIDQFLETVGRRLLPILELFPRLTNQAFQQYQRIIRAAYEASAILDKADDIFKISLMATGRRSRQEQAFEYFRALMNGRQLVSVYTPYGVLEHMAIETISMVQGEATRMVSDMSVTFKQVQTTTSKFSEFNPEKYDSYNSLQIQPPTENGDHTSQVPLERLLDQIERK